MTEKIPSGPTDSSPELTSMTLESQRTDIADGPASRAVIADPEITAAKSQGKLVRERFFRHKGALAGLSGLVFIILLAFTSIGVTFGPLNIPGWWPHTFSAVQGLEDGGAPTLSWTGLGDHPFGQEIGRALV